MTDSIVSFAQIKCNCNDVSVIDKEEVIASQIDSNTTTVDPVGRKPTDL